MSRDGLEPSASTVSAWCSNQLSYLDSCTGRGIRTPIDGFGDRNATIAPDPHNLVDTLGIEPIHSDCKSGGLPLTSGPFRKGEDGRVDIPFYDWHYFSSFNSDDIKFPPLPGISYHHSPINLFCRTGRDRTDDILHVRQALSRLSYSPMVAGSGIEPLTPGFSVPCSTI